MPRLPSIDSIIADSSPQMYAPAPRRSTISGMPGYGGAARSLASSASSIARQPWYSSRR